MLVINCRELYKYEKAIWYSKKQLQLAWEQESWYKPASLIQSYELLGTSLYNHLAYQNLSLDNYYQGNMHKSKFYNSRFWNGHYEQNQELKK